MSDSELISTVNTIRSFPVEDDSEIGSPRVDGPPIMPEDLYAYIMPAYEVPPSPDYIPRPEILQARSSTILLCCLTHCRFSWICSVSDPEDEPEEDDEEEAWRYEEEEEEPAPETFCLPLWKRVRFASPTPSHEVGESSAAGAARQDGPAIAREDPYSVARVDLYGVVDMVDVAPRSSECIGQLVIFITGCMDDLVGAIDEIAPTTLEGVNQRVTDLATIVEEKTTSMYGIMEDAQDDRSQLRGRVNLLYKDRHFHRRLAVMIEIEAKMAYLISKLQSADPQETMCEVISRVCWHQKKRQVLLTKTLRFAERTVGQDGRDSK
ncbi:hypothetical protein Tco_1043837 [Tanacetum coccineum]|uniref:Uncharacterized protein n=1 Tax=Tanacetum coccineum TaxID=301880 RepID=A0ABQ5GQ81_9ASTR